MCARARRGGSSRSARGGRVLSFPHAPFVEPLPARDPAALRAARGGARSVTEEDPVALGSADPAALAAELSRANGRLAHALHDAESARAEILAVLDGLSDVVALYDDRWRWR